MIAWFIIAILGVLALTCVLMVVNAGLQLFLTIIKKPDADPPSAPTDNE